MKAGAQAFRAYYASRTDADLFKVAATRVSFIPLAQQILVEEFARRNLSLPAESRPHPAPAEGFIAASVHRLSRWFRPSQDQ